MLPPYMHVAKYATNPARRGMHVFSPFVPHFLRFVASRWNAGAMLGKVQPYQTESPTKENIMKVRKNLEAVFIAAAFVTTFAAYATAQVPAVRAAAPAAAADTKMAVVVVKAKRLTAAEKAAL